MALAAPETALAGSPRIGVAPTATSMYSEVSRASQKVGITPYPWQRYALQVVTSLRGKSWRWREVAVIVARQNGKTTLLVPRILAGISNGEKILHTAQNRILPRGVFHAVANAVGSQATMIRHANGQEEIRTRSGGSYMIIAPQRSARGHSADLLIIDELREFEDFDFIAAAEPTLTAAENPQVLYVSNAGTESSVVLNDLKNRAGHDDDLAYLEWSADPVRPVADEDGWLEANPSIGYSNLTIQRLRSLYEKYRLSGELAVFETEHLCRWVVTMAPRLVADAPWQMCRGPVESPLRPSLGLSVDPSGQRVATALAWPQSDGSVGLAARDFTGSPIDLTRLAVDVIEQTRGVVAVGFDPWTDQHFARHFAEAKAIQGAEFANASERFVRAIETRQLRWEHADAVSSDLPYAARRATSGTAWVADRGKADRSITAVLAAIRAVWLATNPQILTPAIY